MVSKNSNWEWSGRPPGGLKQRLLSNAGSQFTASNPISSRVHMTWRSSCVGSWFRAAIPHGASWERQERQQPSYFSHSACQSHQAPRRRGTIKIHPCNGPRANLSPIAAGFVERQFFFSNSATVSESASPEEGSSSWSRKEHVEQLERFYDENEYLFADETWGALGQDEEYDGGTVSWPDWVEERLSLSIAAGRVKRVSEVLVWGGSPAFVQKLCQVSSPASLVATHFSLPVLGFIKEMNDDIRSWRGSIEDLPDSYGPFDCVFLNSLTATAHSLDHLLRVVTSLCKPGARIVICYNQGKENLAVGRSKNPHLLLHNLPDSAHLEKMINSMPLTLVELQDEAPFYLAALQVIGPRGRLHTPNGSGEASDENSTQLRATSCQKFPLRARGHIVQGLGRGSKQMGIPTANIDPTELPSGIRGLSKGVYFGWAQQTQASGLDGGVHKMVMNVGNRPTFTDGEQLTVEVHILHYFSADFYGEELSIIVLGFIRDEMKFNSIGDLVQRINTDITTAENRLDEDEMHHFASDAFFITRPR